MRRYKIIVIKKMIVALEMPYKIQGREAMDHLSSYRTKY